MQNPDGDISNFLISGQSLVKENCLNSWISNDIDMKLGQVTKPDKKNHVNVKKLNDEVMSVTCDVIAIFLIYD